MRRALAACSLSLACAAAAGAPCADTVDALRGLLADPAFPLAWEETSMRDARPLVVTLDERTGGLFISFVKTGEGVWAEGPAVLCRVGERLEARFDPARLRVGPATGWMLRRALENGAAIAMRRVAAQELRIGSLGWSGRFVPGTPSVGLRSP